VRHHLVRVPGAPRGDRAHADREVRARARDLEHCQRIGKQFGLDDDACFHTVVTELEWEPSSSRWIIRTDRGDEIRARVEETVRDPATAEALKPWNRQLCKRPGAHDEYLQASTSPAAT